MNRPLKNRTRGKQRGALPARPKLGPALNVSNYDGRANTAAGTPYEDGAFRLQDVQGDGEIVQWLK